MTEKLAEPAAATSAVLEGRVALVTGAGRGIGRAIALELAGAGASVALLARSTEQLEETAALVREVGGRALTVAADVTDPAQRTEAVRRTVEALGPIGVLVNNAGVLAPLGASTEIPAEAFRASIALNVVAVAELTFALLPSMLDAGFGRVANVSSGIVASPQSFVGGNAYVTSKAALEAHTLNLAAELDGSGVTVNVFRPGAVDTAMQAWVREQQPEEVGRALHERFVVSKASGTLLTPETSARSLLTRLPGTETGRIWNVDDPV